jgi:uncharacterized protein YbbC (DUF1343 family)
LHYNNVFFIRKKNSAGGVQKEPICLFHHLKAGIHRREGNRRRKDAAMVKTGCDILAQNPGKRLGERRIGLLSNSASVTSNLVHISEVLASRGIKLDCIFGPQHGFRGETQANMIEWQGYIHPRLGIPVYSLYGEKREPDSFMLEDLDLVLIDLPDIGARPYTYLWTSVLMLKACAAGGVGVMVLDRPNPIGGSAVEGPLLEEHYASFVGLHPLPMRHGLTMGEALVLVNETAKIGCGLEVIRLKGWERSMFFEDTGQPWIMPSPNIPTPETALVYPGTVLLEGTNISEGRGTTRPFELVGAPWIDPERLAERLVGFDFDAVRFRPVHFMPAWDKYADKLCGGVQIHVTNKRGFKPVRCGAAIIRAAAHLYPEHFRWIDPPYEYEFELSPIDVISGGAALREAASVHDGLKSLFDAWKRDERNFVRRRRPFLLY